MARGVDHETVLGVGSWMTCSVGMMVLNKAAISVFPYECTLTALQMLFTVAVLLCGFRYIHIGSLKDALRWCVVTPFYTGMLITSLLALKTAPMTAVIVLRCLSPLLSLVVERFYPSPVRVSPMMVASMLGLIMGAIVYISEMPRDRATGILWVCVNMFLATADRLLQRLMLAKDQQPVDISTSGVTLINNVTGFLVVAGLTSWREETGPMQLQRLASYERLMVLLSCVASVGISYTGVWVQSLISATSFLMLVNANKFIIIIAEASFSHQAITNVQVVGAMIAVSSSLIYGHSRHVEEAEARRFKEPRTGYDAVAKDEKFP